jgi:predicted MFS family arabinose efflux permease
MGIAGAYFVGYILDTYAYPDNFATLFVLAFIFVMVSWVGLALNREPPSETIKHHVSQIAYFRQLPAILRGNDNYRRYFTTRTVVQFGAMATGFFIVYGSERFDLDGTDIVALTALLIGSQAVMGVVWGLIGDRWGHKTVLTSAAVALSLASFSAWYAPTQVWLYGTFILMGAYFTADWVSSLNIILEFCEPADRPTYIGLTNTLLAPSIVLAPLLGAWLATAVGYPGLMIVAALFAAVGALLFGFWVKEPRQANLET